jgi:anaerobic magnesium-protoporphyrin IX monomethyl ester cyclase
MKAVIVDPATPDVGIIPPLGVLYVGSILESAGHDVTLHIRSISDNWDKIGEHVACEDPDLIGVSCLQSVNIERAVETIEDIRTHCDAPIVMGGVHPTVKYEEVLALYPEVDVIALHEAEYTVMDIAHAVEYGEPFSKVKGIAYRDNGTIKVTEKRPFIKNLDDLPFPARHLVSMERFEYDSRGNMITSRGCPYACVFCCVSRMHGRPFRFRTASNIRDEMKELVDVYDIHYSKFLDDTFSYNRSRVVEICNLLTKDPIDMTWGCNTRADRVDEKLLQTMKEAGCVDIYFGIESVSQRILDCVGKKETVKQIEKAIKLSQQIGIKVTGSIIIGLPFETKKEILKTLQFVEDLNLERLGIQILTPHPGSELYDNLDKFGITLLDDDYTLQNQTTPIIETTELKRDEIVELTMKSLKIVEDLMAKSERW